MNKLIYLKDVVTLEFERERCKGCGMCLRVCPMGVFARSNGKVDIQNRDACIECGACRQNCPEEAIRVQSGVGCAAAIINSFLGRTDSSCCCTIETKDGGTKSTGCC
jgi:NAD-dependent dihydropyrimidine dehydrogenase PreA subunit